MKAGFLRMDIQSLKRMNLTKIEVLLDKIALLQETLKTQGDIDLMDLQLLKRYAGQLAALVDEQLGVVVSPAPSLKPETVHAAAEEVEPESTVEDDGTPAFSLSLADEVGTNEVEEADPVAHSDDDSGPVISFFEDAADEVEPKADELPEVPHEPVIPSQPEATTRQTEPSSLFSDDEDDSLNDRFKGDESDLLDKLKKQPIRSLKQEIDLNQKFWFTNELLDGNGQQFNQLLEQLDKAQTLTEASALLHKELESALYDEEKSRAFHKLLELVDRRFMA